MSAIPASFVTGDTTTWTDVLPLYSQAAGYTVVFRFYGPELFTVTGTGTATSWAFAMPTTGKLPGTYGWQQVASKTGNIVTVESGVITVKPNLATAMTTTTAATMLSNLETAILSLTTGLNQSVSFNGQSFTKKDMAQLLAARTKLQAEVKAEQAAFDELAGIAKDRFIHTRFSPAASSNILT